MIFYPVFSNYAQSNPYARHNTANGLGLFAGFGASCPSPSKYEQGRGCCLSPTVSKSGKKICCSLKTCHCPKCIHKHPAGKYSLKCKQCGTLPTGNGNGGNGNGKGNGNGGGGGGGNGGGEITPEGTFMDTATTGLEGMPWGLIAIGGAAILVISMVGKKKKGNGGAAGTTVVAR